MLLQTFFSFITVQIFSRPKWNRMNTHGNVQVAWNSSWFQHFPQRNVMRRTHFFCFLTEMESFRNWLPITARAGPMVYGCMYCARSYNNTLATLKFAGLLHSYLLHLLVEADLLDCCVSPSRCTAQYSQSSFNSTDMYMQFSFSDILDDSVTVSLCQREKWGSLEFITHNLW